MLHRGRAVHPAFGIHDAHKQHADVFTGSEPAEPLAAFYRDSSGAVPQGYHQECGTGQQRADRRDHGGIHAVRDLDVYAQGIGPDTLRIDSGMAIKKRACRARRCRGPAKGVREARRR